MKQDFHQQSQKYVVYPRFLLLTLIACIVPILSFAQDQVCSEKWLSHTQETCSSNSSQISSTHCLQAKFQQAENKLKEVHKALVNDLVDPKLYVGAQSAWEQFRSNECAYEMSGLSCDTKEHMSAIMCIGEINACKLPLTCERVRQLLLHAKRSCNGCPARKSDGK